MSGARMGIEELFPCWKELTDGQREKVKKRVSERRYSKGSRLHRGGEDCSGLFMVREGQLRVYILSESGKEVTMYRLFPWDICLFSASCVMKNISFDMQVEAEKDTDVFVAPPDLYDELMRESMAVSNYTNQLMASRFSDVMWVMEQTLFTSFDSRLASFLLEESRVQESGILKITHEEIARHMGSVREVVTKMLNYLAGEGLVKLSRGKVAILDEKRLGGLIH